MRIPKNHLPIGLPPEPNALFRAFQAQAIEVDTTDGLELRCYFGIKFPEADMYSPTVEELGIMFGISYTLWDFWGLLKTNYVQIIDENLHGKSVTYAYLKNAMNKELVIRIARIEEPVMLQAPVYDFEQFLFSCKGLGTEEEICEKLVEIIDNLERTRRPTTPKGFLKPSRGTKLTRDFPNISIGFCERALPFLCSVGLLGYCNSIGNRAFYFELPKANGQDYIWPRIKRIPWFKNLTLQTIQDSDRLTALFNVVSEARARSKRYHLLAFLTDKSVDGYLEKVGIVYDSEQSIEKAMKGISLPE